MKLLLLAGSAEARALAARLAEAAIPALASALYPPRASSDFPLPLRTGGFGGDAGFAAFLDREGITAVLDAAHPFAARLSARTARICAARGLPYARVLRPAWVPGPRDRWIDAAREEEAAAHIPKGATVFVGTGRGTEDSYANMTARHLIIRQLSAASAPCPFDFAEYAPATPPFTPEGEAAFFVARGVDWLIVRNVGGPGAWPKLEAARALGLPVVMIARPDLPGPQFATLEAAMDWVRRL